MCSLTDAKKLGYLGICQAHRGTREVAEMKAPIRISLVVLSVVAVSCGGLDRLAHHRPDRLAHHRPGEPRTNKPPICPADRIPDLTGTPGAGEGYVRPVVTGSCTATEFVMSSNGMPSYPYAAKTPNPLIAQNWNFSFTLTPKIAAQPTSIRGLLSIVGFSLTGLPIFTPIEAQQPARQAFGDPVYNGIVDLCKGHTAPVFSYHLHAIDTLTACNLGPDPIVGYALDGFPIYGPQGCLDRRCNQVVTFESSYVRTGDPTTNAWDAYSYVANDDPKKLDECNGRIGPDGTYRYHATSAWPYVIGCFTGSVSPATGAAATAAAAAMPAMG